MTTSYRSLTLLSVAVFALLSYNFMSASWTAPTGTPPANNTPAPVNVGSTTQAKTGNFSASIVAATTEMRANRYCDALGNNCFFGNDPVAQQLWTFNNGTVETNYPVKVNNRLDVSNVVTASTPTGDTANEVSNIDFLKKLFTDVYGYTDYGNMRDSQAVPQVNYSNMREFYHADQATADYLCRYIGFDKGTWTWVDYSGNAWWNYHNLSIVTYDPNLGVPNQYSNTGQRFMCFGAASCSGNTVPFIANLRCLASAENPLQEKIFSEVYIPADQIENFKVNLSTQWVATSYWNACSYASRSDGLNYNTTRTVRCHDSATNTYVADNQCISAPLTSWRPFATLDQCNAFRTNGNLTPPFSL